MIHYAFDYGGVLEDRPHTEELLKSLLVSGHAVSIISAVGSTHEFGPRTEHCVRLGVPRENIRCFVISGDMKPDGVFETEVGRTKAAIMRELGCDVLFDDNPFICRAVRAAGLQAYQVLR